MNKRLKVLLLFLVIPIEFLYADQYGSVSSDKLRAISDVVVIGQIVSSEMETGINGDSCHIYAQVKVLHSFKPSANAGDLISIKSYLGHDINELFLLYLTKTDKTNFYEDQRITIIGDIEKKIRCADTEKPDYKIIMEGLGAQDIIVADDNPLEKGQIQFNSYWIIPPITLSQHKIGEGWKEITIVNVSDFIKYSDLD